MARSSAITELLNASLASINELLPVKHEQPALVAAPIRQTDHGVLVGVVGDVKGRLLVLGEAAVFSEAGLSMYGMELSGEMLESFVGEFGNSVAGHMATKLFANGITVDITPPTTMQGNVSLGGFAKAIRVPFKTEKGSQGELILAVEAV